MAIYDRAYFLRGSKYAIGEGSNESAAHLAAANEADRVAFVKKQKPTGRILDVGSATGGFLTRARAEGYVVTGVEISEDAAAEAQKNGIDVKVGTLRAAALPTGGFDLITLWDVIEHLPEPHETLREVVRLLDNDGLLIISTGDADSSWARLTGKYWPLLTPPQHLFLYSVNTIQLAFELNGLVLESVARLSKNVSMDLLSLKAVEAAGPLLKPLRTAIIQSGLGSKGIRLNLGDIVTCVGSVAASG